jgi:hypothetical protein
MKKVFFICAFGIIAIINCSAQTSLSEKEAALVPPANEVRYGVDFTIVEWNTIDKSILEQIDLSQYEALRHDSNDAEIELTQFNITLKLFSKIKTLENESNSKVYMDYFHKSFVKER